MSDAVWGYLQDSDDARTLAGEVVRSAGSVAEEALGTLGGAIGRGHRALLSLGRLQERGGEMLEHGMLGDADRGSVEALLGMQAAATHDLEASLVRQREMYATVTPFLR